MILTTFGWAGITLSVPDDWEISGISGDQKSGYLRLDDAEMPRLELKWSESKKRRGVSQEDLHSVLDEYFKLVRKSYRRKRDKKTQSSDLNITRDIDLLKKDGGIDLHAPIFFQWRGDVFAHGVIYHCPDSKRITIAQVMGRTRQSLRSVSIPLFLSLKNLPSGEIGSEFLWSAYQMSFRTPERYRLEKHQLLSGYLLFSFVDSGPFLDRKRRLSVERYGLADVLLKNCELEDWFRNQYRKSLQGFGYQIEIVDDGVDQKFTLVGQENRLSDNIPIQPVQNLDRLQRRKNIATHVRHCRQSNRIFVVQSVSKREALQVVNGVASSIVCHSDMDDLSINTTQKDHAGPNTIQAQIKKA